MKNITLSHSAEDTCALAAQLAPELQPGDTIALLGDLGSGKTVFARGIASALGIQGPISSPTYTIQQTYKTNTRVLHHIDLYRISSAEEVDLLDLESCWDGEDITMIEWADRATGLLPERTWYVTFFSGDQPNMRTIEITRPA